MVKLIYRTNVSPGPDLSHLIFLHKMQLSFWGVFFLISKVRRLTVFFLFVHPLKSKIDQSKGVPLGYEPTYD